MKYYSLAAARGAAIRRLGPWHSARQDDGGHARHLVLDVAHYPKASFTITSPPPSTAIVERIEGSNALRSARALAILQTSYGITPYSAIGGIVGVTDKLDIWGEIVFRPSL